MNKISLIILLSIICGNVFSQDRKKLSESAKQVFEQTMMAEVLKIKTLQCDFVQEKTSTLVNEKSVATGFLLYQSPSMLRWEYTALTPSILILNGKDAVFRDKNGKEQGNATILKQLGGIIISMINGESLRQNKIFSTDVFETDKNFTVILTPLQKRLQNYYNFIELTLDKNTFLASGITMYEKSGDKTVISLNNKEINIEFDSTKFVLK
jgi:outer membrane lipoprotein carrier protein